MKTKKTFDCMAMKDRAQKNIRAKLDGKSHKEEIAFFRKIGEEFQRQIDLAREKERKV